MEVRVNVTMDDIFTDMCFGMWNWLDYSEEGVPQYYDYVQSKIIIPNKD